MTRRPIRIPRLLTDGLVASALLASQANAAPDERGVLLRGPGVDQTTLQAWAEGDGWRTLVEHLDAHRPAVESEARLRTLVEAAQSAWLAGETRLARSRFTEIAGLARLDDWREAQRESIHYAMVRLAESESTEAAGEAWLEKAARAFPDLKPDADVFPPGLIERALAARERVLAKAPTWQPTRDLPDYRVLLVNGHRVSLEEASSVKLPSGPFRMSAFSDARPPLSRIVDLSKGERLLAESRPLVSGDCEAPQLADFPGRPERVHAIFPGGCERSWSKSGGWEPRAKAPSVDVAPSEELQEIALASAKAPARVDDVGSTRTWLWVAVAAVAIGGAIAAQNEISRSEEGSAPPQILPVHRRGF